MLEKPLLKSSVMDVKFCIDITEVFCNLNDFYQRLEPHYRSVELIPWAIMLLFCFFTDLKTKN